MPCSDNTARPLVDIILPDITVGHPDEALHYLANMASPHISIDTRIIQQRLMALEKQEGTGIGSGVALPHLRLSGADQSLAIFARNRHWLDFEAVDDTPVNLLCLLVSPADYPAGHLRRLSRLTRALRDNVLLSRLRAAESRDVIEILLTSDSPSHLHAA